MKRYFTRELLYNLLIAFVLTLILLVFVQWGLKVYTRHGQTLKVPDIRGKKLQDAEKILDQANLDYEIMDSTYVSDHPPMAIIDQTPKPDAVVKAGRTIYLTVNASNAPVAEIPDLVGKSSYKYARMQLEGLGFKVGEPVYRPDPHQNSVLDILINGRPLRKGAKVSKGSVITLVIGDKLSNQIITVPYLIGLRYEEAIVKLREEYNLNIGTPILNDDVTDTLKAFVWKQEPAYGSGNTIRVGEEIDLFLGREMPQDIVIHPEWYGKVDTVK